jgi:hypothetical protein
MARSQSSKLIQQLKQTIKAIQNIDQQMQFIDIELKKNESDLGNRMIDIQKYINISESEYPDLTDNDLSVIVQSLVAKYPPKRKAKDELTPRNMFYLKKLKSFDAEGIDKLMAQMENMTIYTKYLTVSQLTKYLVEHGYITDAERSVINKKYARGQFRNVFGKQQWNYACNITQQLNTDEFIRYRDILFYTLYYVAKTSASVINNVKVSDLKLEGNIFSFNMVHRKINAGLNIGNTKRSLRQIYNLYMHARQYYNIQSEWLFVNKQGERETNNHWVVKIFRAQTKFNQLNNITVDEKIKKIAEQFKF